MRTNKGGIFRRYYGRPVTGINPRGYPELRRLREAVTAGGVDQGCAREMIDALAEGPRVYAQRLAGDDAARRRFLRGWEALTAARGEVSPDALTVGALTWLCLRGRAFIEAIEAHRGAAPETRAA